MVENETEFKWTVFYKDSLKPNVLQREHFVNKTGKEGAIPRVNALLRKGYKAWLRTYSPPKRPIDYIAERGPNG